MTERDNIRGKIEYPDLFKKLFLPQENNSPIIRVSEKFTIMMDPTLREAFERISAKATVGESSSSEAPQEALEPKESPVKIEKENILSWITKKRKVVANRRAFTQLIPNDPIDEKIFLKEPLLYLPKNPDKKYPPKIIEIISEARKEHRARIDGITERFFWHLAGEQGDLLFFISLTRAEKDELKKLIHQFIYAYIRCASKQESYEDIVAAWEATP